MKNAPVLTTNAVLSRLVNMTTNLLLSRTAALEGRSLDPPNRDYDKECGYPSDNPTLDQYRQMVERVGVATRVNSVFSSESWSIEPQIFQVEDPRVTAFERAWKKLVFRMNPFHYLERADEMSGIGRFGILLLGIDDGKALDQPVDGIDEKGQKVTRTSDKSRNLLYLRVFPEYLVTVQEVEKDPNNPRFNEPIMYRIKTSDPRDMQSESSLVSDENTQTSEGGVVDLDVHWTRVIHIADNRGTSEIYGTPRLKAVYNYILDVRKVVGGSAEMFWKGAFPGISFETFPELTAEAELDAESVKKEIEAYSNGLQRYMRLVGMSAKSLAPQVADPSNHLTSLLQLICATIQVPLKVFMGSESGHLASTEDSVAWNRRLKKRQNTYITPMILKPFINRLMYVDILPWVEEYNIEWRDLNVLSDTDKAQISLQKAQALLQYVTSGTYTLVPPRMFLELVLGFSTDEAKTIIDNAGGEDKIVAALKQQVLNNAGNSSAGSGTRPTKKTGAGGRKNGMGKAK